MKNEKLTALVNKLVEFNNGKVHLKGYLFTDDRNPDEFYIKPIAVFKGTKEEALEEHRFDFINSDSKHIKYAETPKLMKVSMKSWHYRLMKYVLRDNCPTPKTMQNGCPYFWLLIFSMFAVPFILLAKGIFGIFMALPYLITTMLDGMVDSFIGGLDDYKACDIAGYRRKAPYFANKYMKKKNMDVMDLYLKKKYGIDYKGWESTEEEREAYNNKKAEIRKKYQEQLDKLLAKRAEQERKRDAAREIEYERARERQRKADERNARIAARMEPFYKAMRKFGDGFKFNPTKLIKGTKQVLGFLISSIILGAVAGIIVFLTRLIFIIIDALKELFSLYGTEIGIGALIVLALGLLVLICIYAYNKIQAVVLNYKSGEKVWYITLLINIFWVPIVALFKGLGYSFLYILIKPAIFIFYTILFLMVLKPIGMFFAYLGVALWNVLGSSFGIFGEYFSASKKDYCPGLEWTDVD